MEQNLHNFKGKWFIIWNSIPNQITKYEDKIDIFRHAIKFLNNYPYPWPSTYTRIHTRHTFWEDTGICVTKQGQQSRKTNESEIGIQCGRKAKGIPKMKMKESPRKISVPKLTEQSIQFRIGKQRVPGGFSSRKP